MHHTPRITNVHTHTYTLIPTGKNAKELEERMKTGEIAGEQDFSVDPYEPHPDFRFSKGAIMSENEWIDLSDAMEKNDGYVKRDSQAMKDRPGEKYFLPHFILIYLMSFHRGRAAITILVYFYQHNWHS